jgi:hypothetical protein
MRFKATLYVDVADEHEWDTQALGDVLTEELNHMGDVSVTSYIVEEPAGCDVSMLSSRACEKGTRGCVIRHEAPQELPKCKTCGGTRCM